MRWRPSGLSACVIYKGRQSGCQVSPHGLPHMHAQTGGGETSQNAAQLCARAQGCVNDDLRADRLRKGWGFQVSTWNVDSLTGRAGEVVVEALSDREVDVVCIQET